VPLSLPDGMTDQHGMSQEFQGMFSSPECDSTEAERIVFPSGYLFQVAHYVNKSVTYAAKISHKGTSRHVAAVEIYIYQQR